MASQTTLLATIWSLWGLAFIATVLRAIVRRRIQNKFQAEDYLAFLGFLFLTGLTSVVTVMAPLFGTEQDYLKALVADPDAPPPYPMDVMIERTILALKLMFSQMLLFWSTIWASKFSLLIFFRQLVVGLPRYMIVWWAAVILVLCSYLGCMLSNFLTCVPLTKYWSATGCSDIDNIHRSDVSIRAATALDIFADLLIMILPLRLLWILRISIQQKLGLACLFSLGIVVVIFAFIRLYNITKATAESTIDPTTLADGPIILSLWSQIEASVSVIVANLPAFRSLLRRQLGGSYYVSKSSGMTSSSNSKNMYQFHHTGKTDSRSKSKSAIRHQSVELASLDGNDEDHWPTTSKAAKMLGYGNEINAKKLSEDGILRSTEVKITRTPRIEHIRTNSGNAPFGLQLRPDLS